ncbi:hypothetical protein AGMMS50233_01420 [Endomicrobiia bacterium]|nr:hypothetical protein AGMMS50233_01420 [Endomicrobiia bacterium]
MCPNKIKRSESNSTPTPTITLDLTDLDNFIAGLPDTPAYPADHSKPTLTKASKALKHVTAVINRTIPADTEAFITIYNLANGVDSKGGFPVHAYPAPATACFAARCAIFFVEYVASKVADRPLNIPLHYAADDRAAECVAQCAYFADRTEAFATHGAGAYTAADYANLSPGNIISRDFDPDRDARLALAANELAKKVRELEEFFNKHIFKKT